MTAKSDLLIEELVSAAVAFGREKEPDWQTRIEKARRELREYIAELTAHSDIERQDDKMKPCPFCGNEPVVEGNLVACNNLNCPTYDNYWTDPMIFTCDQWNTRPIEYALNARIAECESALISMVQQFFYNKDGEDAFRHAFMSAEEEAATYLVEHGIAYWAGNYKSAIRFIGAQERER